MCVLALFVAQHTTSHRETLRVGCDGNHKIGLLLAGGLTNGVDVVVGWAYVACRFSRSCLILARPRRRRAWQAGCSSFCSRVLARLARDALSIPSNGTRVVARTRVGARSGRHIGLVGSSHAGRAASCSSARIRSNRTRLADGQVVGVDVLVVACRTRAASSVVVAGVKHARGLVLEPRRANAAAVAATLRASEREGEGEGEGEG